jgi:hypothetical protein
LKKKTLYPLPGKKQKNLPSPRKKPKTLPTWVKKKLSPDILRKKIDP